MAKECKYIDRQEVKDYKRVIEGIFLKIKSDFKKKFGKPFNCHLVGSAKRNLVIKKGNSHWDVDYQVQLLSKVFDGIEEKEIKEYAKKRFKHHFGSKYSVRHSTSVITIFLKDDEGSHAIKSFDVALFKKNPKNDNWQILKGTTPDENQDNCFRWEDIKKISSMYEKRKKIKGSEMWNTFRDIFKEKKCENMNINKAEQKPTFALYLETIKETLDKF